MIVDVFSVIIGNSGVSRKDLYTPLERLLQNAVTEPQRSYNATQLMALLQIDAAELARLVDASAAVGVEIIDDSGCYRLPSDVSLLDMACLRRLESEPRRLFYRSLTSTNQLLKQLGQEKANTVNLVYADHQSAGVGQRGKVWQSGFGRNIYLSVLWRLEGYAQLAGLSLSIGVIVLNMLERCFGVQGLGLKWPNDIYLKTAQSERKIAGILVESCHDANGELCAVIGIGLNYAVQSDDDKAGVLDAIGVHGERMAISRSAVLQALIEACDAAYSVFLMHGFSVYRQSWRQKDLLANRRVVIEHEGEVMTGTVVGVGVKVDEVGALLFVADACPEVTRVLHSAQIISWSISSESDSNGRQAQGGERGL